MVERLNTIHGSVVITKYVVTLYTDSQYLHPVKNQEFNPAEGTAVDEYGNLILFDELGNIIKTDRSGKPELDEEGNTIIDTDPIIYKQYIYCGLTPKRTYYYTVDVYKHLSYSVAYLKLDRSFVVSTSGWFTVGKNGKVEVKEKSAWESETCKGYYALVEWFFDRDEIYADDNVRIRWEYDINDEGWVEVPSHYISSVFGSANIQHIAIEFESLYGDISFSVLGTPLNEDGTVNEDYTPIEYHTEWVDNYSSNTGNTENVEENNG
jgi:hypothetical protein